MDKREAGREVNVRRNKHPNCDGTPWGWFEDEKGRNIGYWSGVEERETKLHSLTLAAALSSTGNTEDKNADIG